MAGIKMVHVPYKGGGLVLADMISGQVQVGFTATISGMPHVRSGKLKALGVTSLKRAQAFPEVPTISEAGVPGFKFVNWYGIFAPAATPPAIIAALHRAHAFRDRPLVAGQARSLPDLPTAGRLSPDKLLMQNRRQ